MGSRCIKNCRVVSLNADHCKYVLMVDKSPVQFFLIQSSGFWLVELMINIRVNFSCIFLNVADYIQRIRWNDITYLQQKCLIEQPKG